MKERQAVERLISRMYKHHLKSTGRLPGGRELREMERKAVRAAEASEKKRQADGSEEG